MKDRQQERIPCPACHGYGWVIVNRCDTDCFLCNGAGMVSPPEDPIEETLKEAGLE